MGYAIATAMETLTITENIATEALLDLNISKSMGPEEMSPKIMKE